jgi:hypothetical protein
VQLHPDIRNPGGIQRATEHEHGLCTHRVYDGTDAQAAAAVAAPGYWPYGYQPRPDLRPRSPAATIRSRISGG